MLSHFFCRSEAEVDLHKWLLIQGGSRIKIGPNQPLRSKGAAQGPGYDCFIGEVRPELGLAMSGIWFWVNQRYIQALWLPLCDWLRQGLVKSVDSLAALNNSCTLSHYLV